MKKKKKYLAFFSYKFFTWLKRWGKYGFEGDIEYESHIIFWAAEFLSSRNPETEPLVDTASYMLHCYENHTTDHKKYLFSFHIFKLFLLHVRINTHVRTAMNSQYFTFDPWGSHARPPKIMVVFQVPQILK